MIQVGTSGGSRSGGLRTADPANAAERHILGGKAAEATRPPGKIGAARDRLGRRFGNRRSLLAFAELEPLARAGLAGLFALLHPRIAAEQARRLEQRAEFGIVLRERA